MTFLFPESSKLIVAAICFAHRDGKVRFGPVLQWILENPEPDYWFGPLIMANLRPDRWFGPKRSGSGLQVVRTMNWTLIYIKNKINLFVAN